MKLKLTLRTFVGWALFIGFACTLYFILLITSSPSELQFAPLPQQTIFDLCTRLDIAQTDFPCNSDDATARDFFKPLQNTFPVEYTQFEDVNNVLAPYYFRTVRIDNGTYTVSYVLQGNGLYSIDFVFNANDDLVEINEYVGNTSE